MPQLTEPIMDAHPGLAPSSPDPTDRDAAEACGATPHKEAQIIDGAARVFARDGYEGASMSRIAAESGVSKGTLYNYFSSKAHLFTAYVRRECSRWIALVFDQLDPATPPEDVLRQVGQRMIAMMLSVPGLLMYRMVVAEAEKFPELAHAFYAEGPARATAHVSAYLSRMNAEGRLRVEHPEFAAEQFFALVQTQLCMKRRLGLIDMPSAQQIDHVVNCAVELFMRGYGA